MPFEVGKYHKGVLVGRMAAHGHFFEPFATVNGQCQSIFLVHDVDGAECPAVHFQRPPVLFGRVTVALVIGVCFHNIGIGKVFVRQSLYLLTGYNVRSVLFPGMQFYTYMSLDISTYLFIRFD